jgi:transcription termination factor Rho
MLHKQDNEVEALKFIYNTMGKKETNAEFLESMNTDK